MDRTDAELWTESLQGSGQAFGVLFDRHYRTVVAHCGRAAIDRHTAEDLASLTFLEAWRLRRRVSLVPNQSIAPWLLGIATNVALNANRATRRYRRLLARLPAEATEHSAEVLADERSTRELAGFEARQALNGLSVQQRRALELCDLHRRPHVEAAREMGVSVRTLQRILATARAAVRTTVENSRSISK